MVRGVNWQAGNTVTSLPKLVIVDRGSSPGATGWMYRLMDWHDAHVLSPGDLVQLWNERDSCVTQEERMDAITYARSLGLKPVYGGDVVDPATGWSFPPDPVILANCDYYGIHCTTWSPTPFALMYNKAVITTELEQAPEHLDWAAVIAWMARSLTPTFYFTWSWRSASATDSLINLCDHDDVISAIAAMVPEPTRG